MDTQPSESSGVVGGSCGVQAGDGWGSESNASAAAGNDDGLRALDALRCPYCRSAFSARFVSDGYGLLRCSCGVFPVVDGIPIVLRAHVGMYEHTTGETQVRGVEVADVVRLIEAGRTREALLECLVVPEYPAWVRRVVPWRVAHSDAGRWLARAVSRRRLYARVLARAESLTAQDLFEFFYRPEWPLGPALGQYFLFRFCQPRHLAALALLSRVPSSQKPILDIACGAGHLAHYLTRRTDPSPVIGTDLNFFQLWIAKRWVAPAAQFVCANAEDGLPFAYDAIGAVLCSDAYHYIRARGKLQDEIARCAPARPVVLTRVGNRAVMPNEGSEVDLVEYLSEIGCSSALAFCESDLLRCYLEQADPFGQEPAALTRLCREKWLSFAWNVPERRRTAEAWPHGVGTLGVNPLYQLSAGEARDVLRFSFPGSWYAYENHAMLSYHPKLARVPGARVGAWGNDAELAALVRSCVVIGLPDRFVRSQADAAR